MGGNALNVTTVRLSKADFLRVTDIVLSVLQNHFPSASVSAIPAYRQKQDFGDLDVLLSYDNDIPHDISILKSIAKKHFNATCFFHNASILSFDYRDSVSSPAFQIDIIQTPFDCFDFSLNYFSWNDLGNLMGRIAHKMGFSFGHLGLRYSFFVGNDQKYASILVCKSFQKSLEFLGYDYSRFSHGFDSLLDIFNFVVSSPFFNSRIFLLENRNVKSRTRDRKRKTYMQFLEFCSQNSHLPEFEYHEKSVYLDLAFQYFQDFEPAYRKVEFDYDRERRAKAIFNGENVSEWTGLRTIKLGQLMAAFRKSFENKEQMYDFILENGEVAVRTRISRIRSHTI
ncbi:hypothetical protein RCL1_000050 [Eukaryota sp. TZLM3-RCL]